MPKFGTVAIDSAEIFNIYAAGFFDGEGCISTSHQSGYDYLQITIAQRHPALMSLFQVRWGGTITVAKDGCTFWRLSKTKEQEVFLRAISPYLRLRDREVEISLQFLSVGSSRDNLRNQYIKAKLLEVLHEASETRKQEATAYGEVCDGSD